MRKAILKFAIMLACMSAPTALTVSAADYTRDGAAYFYSNEYGFENDPATMMKSYSIILPGTLNEQQVGLIEKAAAKHMTVAPGMETSLSDDFSDFKPMSNDMVSKYAPLYKSGDTDMSNWYMTSDVTYSTIASGILVVKVANGFYAGGAHGGYGVSYLNYDPEKGKFVTLDDYVKTDNGKKALKKKLYSMAKKELKSNLFSTSKDFEVADTYRLTDKGIEFVYQEYQIGPYSAGLPSFTIPYSTLKTLDSSGSGIYIKSSGSLLRKSSGTRKTGTRKTGMRKTSR